MDISKLAHLAAVAAIIILLLQFASAGTLADVFNAFANLGKENSAYDFDSSGGPITIDDILAALENISNFGSVLPPPEPPEVIECSAAGDCGSLTVSDPYCDGSDVKQDTTIPLCLNPGTAQSACDTNVTTTVAAECAYGCLDGDCLVEPPPEGECSTPEECGSITLGPLYCDGNSLVQDTTTPICTNPGTAQSTCGTSPGTATVEECAYGCLDGNCIVLQGECDSAADCGAIAVGDPYCDGSDVVQDTNTPVCTDPGTAQSACDINAATAVVEACASPCVDGACIEGWYSPDWAYRREITLGSAYVSSTVSNFVVKVKLSGADDIFSDALPNGNDLIFVDDQGSELNFHIETWDPAGIAAFNVKVPEISSSADTTLWLYYGNPDGTGYGNTAGTFSGMALFYEMDAATGGIDLGPSGRNYAGKIGSPSASDGTYGKGTGFGGSDGWSMANVSYWESAWSARTHNARFKTGPDITTRQVIWAEGGGSIGAMLYIRNGELYLSYWPSSGTWNSVKTGISPNTEYAVTGSYKYGSGGFWALYVNGAEAGSKIPTASIGAHSGDGGIAYTGITDKIFDNGNANGQYFKGDIYEFFCSNTAWTENEHDIWVQYG